MVYGFVSPIRITVDFVRQLSLLIANTNLIEIHRIVSMWKVQTDEGVFAVSIIEQFAVAECSTFGIYSIRISVGFPDTLTAFGGFLTFPCESRMNEPYILKYTANTAISLHAQYSRSLSHLV
jgi:hypothetical protein